MFAVLGPQLTCGVAVVMCQDVGVASETEDNSPFSNRLRLAEAYRRLSLLCNIMFAV